MPRKPALDGRQQDLFENHFLLPQAPALVPGGLNYAAELCGALSGAIKSTDLSRAEVAARMSDLTGDSITEPMLNAWTAKSHDRHRFPFEYAAAFEAATESTALQQLLAAKRGSIVLVGREALDAQLGRVRRQREELARQERALQQMMRGAR